MYQYTEFDQQFIRLRADQYRDQLERFQAGKLSGDEFKPLRLQNGWYVQRYAPMLRVAVPYGELSSGQLRVLARIAREYDIPEPALLAEAQATQEKLGDIPLADGRRIGTRLKYGYGHFTTRTNVQYNWIPLDKSADVMDLLASVHMHGIQTSGNCIRNITSDALAGIAADEIADPRPFAEILRQWSTLHPEFAFLPRKFKVSLNGAREDRAALGWYDVGLQLVKNGAGELGFQVRVGGGMGRTPVISPVVREFLPWNQLMNYLEAVIRVYNRYGRRDNLWKARIKILVKSEGQTYVDQVEEEFRQIVEVEGGPHTITQAEYDRVAACFHDPVPDLGGADAESQTLSLLRAAAEGDQGFGRWLTRNVLPHRHPLLRAVVLSFKRVGHAPGDATADQMDAAADLADRYSCGEARVTHEQNLLLPWVRADQLPALYQEARALGLAQPNIGLLTDMIACPGGDFCSLANARSLPIAEAITERYQDLDELWDLGEIDLHISGCINSCGHHHSGHIGILGVDKDGKEWYQITLGGADGTDLSGPAVPGKIIGPSFSAAEVPGVIEALLATYRDQRQPLSPEAAGSARGQKHEHFIDTVRRVGIEPFKAAANAARHPAESVAA
ncbi:nitrite/sulfite reductase [Paracidovorax citrulli]|uniref:Nitrite/sulfite reductase, hemoprotein beta-component, ferrodoxin domain protein n=2 Tax=Paracidovorax citrulli TaxID=80869 RepID=A1TRN1_PARC0|nr:nitrite/sulfite reductase [Paracidovorax citrulli]ABM33619.1 nitrite/sulfite reductase, hemoprotein beta-component, ferrodoxin domain protein [Paracidovorax citrulli AAC00-1]ATG94226.1 nitrite reductase [Paracidovorax citrulli]MVT28277.1 nitrite reductase [Paracidovorax citrulli]PVY63048.1 sulfite reductase (NADPH) hemoprotein beta-component [Paracidovorax citrulli]QCX12652.1 Sulfite reductase [ferredoxin] [Paracidovorax citrulli]